MTEIMEMIAKNGAGLVALSAIFYFTWYVIQHIVPVLLEVKASNEMNVEVIKYNSDAIRSLIEALKKIEMQNDSQIKDHSQIIKNYEVHNERTIRVEQTLGILLDRIDK